MKIAILGAMEIEIKPFLEKIKNYKTIKHGHNNYYIVNYNGNELILAYSRIGKVFSAITATIMIEKFNADIVLFTGVAGGIGDNIKVGDIILATDTVQHDVDITAFGHPKGKIPNSEVKISTSKELLNKAIDIAKEQKINIYTGTVATGDQFISNKEVKTLIKDEFNAKAIEMEGASVNLVCYELNKPCLILRSISDTADGEACESFDEFAIKEAKRSANFILKLIDKI